MRIRTLTAAVGMVLALFAAHPAAMAQSGRVDLTLEPGTVTAQKDSAFDLTIRATPVGGQKLAAMDVFLNFNPAYLEVVDSLPGEAGVQVRPGNTLSELLQNAADNAAGTINYSAGTLTPSPNNAFTVATVSFRVKQTASGSSTITFSTASPRQTVIAYQGNSVTGSLTGAAASVDAAPPPVAPIPPPVQPPPQQPPPVQPPPVQPPPTTPPPAPSPGQFQTGELSVRPAEAKAGETVTVSAIVTNTGDVAGKKTVVLKINDAAAQTKETPALEPKKSATVSFTVTQSQPGTYKVDVDGQVARFTVVAAAAPSPSPSPTPPAGTPAPPPAPPGGTPAPGPAPVPPPDAGQGGLDTWVWIVIGAAAVGVVVLLLIRRRASY